MTKRKCDASRALIVEDAAIFLCGYLNRQTVDEVAEMRRALAAAVMAGAVTIHAQHFEPIPPA